MLNDRYHKYLTKVVVTSESKYVLEPEYLHLHENDISEDLDKYNLLDYIFRFIDSIHDLKEDLDYLVCCYSFENKSKTTAANAQKKLFYYFKFTDFSWKSQEEFLKKYEKYNVRPKLISFGDEKEGLHIVMKDIDLLQPYILIEKDKSADPVFNFEKKPNEKKLKEKLKVFQDMNSYQSAWYGFKFKSDKVQYWTTDKDSKDRLTVLAFGFINHIIGWNYELKNAHERSKTQKKLEFQTLINISSHVVKTALKTDIISEIVTIENPDNEKLLAKLKKNSQHIFVLQGITNLLTKIEDIPAFKKTAINDELLSTNEVNWQIKNRVEDYSENFFKRKGFKIILRESKNISQPKIRVHDLFFSDHLIKSFLNTLLENVELHGYFVNNKVDEVCFVEIEKKGKAWIFSNRAKEEFTIDSHKLKGNILFYKSLIELTDSGKIGIDCKKEDDEIYFTLTITTK